MVGKNDKKFLNFYPIDESYRVVASFERINDVTGFDMNTSSGMKKKHFKYGLLTFKIHDSLVHLFLFTSLGL